MKDFLMLADAANSAAEANSGGGNNSWWILILVYGAIIVGAYFLLFRPQSKRKKKEAAMRKNAQIGDEITTIGGICGRIVAIKEESDSVIIETGTDRNKMKLKRWAISTVDTANPQSAPAPVKEKKEKESAKELKEPAKEVKESSEKKGENEETTEESK